MRLLNKNIKLFLNYVVGPAVFLILLWSIRDQIRRQPDWRTSLEQIQLSFRSAGWWKSGLVILLLFVNWGLEAGKWKIAIRGVQPLSFFRAFQAVFTGSTLAFFTPNRMGEYVGRILYVDPGKRIQVISLTIVCSIAQLIVTVWMGVLGIVGIRAAVIYPESGSVSPSFWLAALGYSSVVAGIILTLIYFRLPWMVRWIEKIPRIEKFTKYIEVLDGFRATGLLKILSLSIIRYLVFVLQYDLLFQVFEVPLNIWQVFWSVSVVFLILAIVPTIAVLSELGIRWKASIEVVQMFSANTVGILATSLAIWLINLVVPALIGSLLILRIRLFKKSS